MATGAEATIERLRDAWNAHDTEGVLACFTDDCVYEDVAFEIKMQGHEGLRQFADMLFRTIPDFGYEMTAHVVGDKAAAVEYVLTGTPRFDLQGNEVEPYALTKRGASFMELRGDKIHRQSDYVDSAGVKA
jgi:steroid delta-isomerase-like uncharacterized protein